MQKRTKEGNRGFASLRASVIAWLPLCLPLQLSPCLYVCLYVYVLLYVPLCVPLLARATARLLPSSDSAWESAFTAPPCSTRPRQPSLPLPSSLETVQPPNDPNNHTHRPLGFSASVFQKNHKTQGIDRSIYKQT